MNRQILIDKLKPYLTVSIIGMCKNAGKTTVLNALMSEYKKINCILGITSIGNDGKDKDIITKSSKPLIYVKANTLIATASDLLSNCDTTNEILYSSGINTPLGEVVIFKALSDGYVSIAGPSDVKGIKQICNKLIKFGAAKVLIDGAANRIANTSPNAAEAYLLCSSATLNPSMAKTVSLTSFMCKILTLPKIKGQFDSNSDININSIVTDDDINKLLSINTQPVKRIIVDNPSKLFISEKTYYRLLNKDIELYVKHRAELIAVAINPTSAKGYYFDKDEFKVLMTDSLNVPVINVEEDYVS